MMSEEAGFLEALKANPADDTARLVYADWLDEHDEPERAEFIRVECEAACTGRESATYMTLLRRSDRLLRVHASRWFGPLVEAEVADHIITSRGFVDCIVLAADSYAAHAEIIAEYAPLLRGLPETPGP